MKITAELKEKAEKLLSALEKEMERLPDHDIFGGSNIEHKELATAAIADLRLFLDESRCMTMEVHSYLHGGDDYMLGDWL